MHHLMLYLKLHSEPELLRAENESLELSAWLNYVDDKCITIDDIAELSYNESMQVLVMDRNLADVVCNDDINRHGIAQEPQEFFLNSTAIYTHDHDMRGTISWLRNGDGVVDEVNDFEFHLEYQPHRWYPLKHGLLPQKDPQGFFHFPDDMPRDYRAYPVTTRVGWRGPMLRFVDLVGLPKVFCPP